MSVHSGPRAEWWFGKRTKLAPGTEAGTDAQDRWGKVSRTHRWFSYDWWFGHHMQREGDGTWKDEGRTKPTKASAWKGSGQLGKRGGNSAAARKRQAEQDYRAYTHERFLAAEKATNGYMVTPAGRAKGYTGADFFDPDARRRPGMKWATDELRAWFGHGSAAAGVKGSRGGLLSATAYAEQTRERAA